MQQNDSYYHPLVKSSNDSNVYDTLDVIYENRKQIIQRMNTCISRGIGRNTNTVFYDVTNFFFEVEEPDEDEVDGVGRREFRRKAQMVFQDPLGSLNPRMKIGAALGEVLRVHGLARGREEVARRVAEWLATVELDGEYADRFPHELSGGQRQRVNLARSLCTGAEFLVADEPVSALDVSVQARILKLLKDLQRQRGITLLFIGHDLAVMKHMADRVLVMNRGEIVERGAAAEVLGNPQHEYTRELLAAVPRI